MAKSMKLSKESSNVELTQDFFTDDYTNQHLLSIIS